MQDVIKIGAQIDKPIITRDIRLESRIGLEIDITVRDPQGAIKRQETLEGHSFVGNFLKFLYACAMDAQAPDGIAFKDTGGTDRTLDYSYLTSQSSGTYGVLYCPAPAGEDDFGIVLGSDDGSVEAKNIDNYSFTAPVSHIITHGTAAGNLQYGGHAIIPSYSNVASGFSSAGISRAFSNGSGGDVTVKEIGLICRCRGRSDSPYYINVLLIRDILSSPLTVGNQESLSISYRIKCLTTGTGGFLQQFPSLLARQFMYNQTDTCKDCGGTDRTYASSAAPLRLISAGGMGNVGLQTSSGAGYDVTSTLGGIVIGAANTAVAPNNFDMAQLIPSGADQGTPNEIMYYGTVVYGLEIDNTGTGTGEFTVEALFRNVCGASQQVAEIGLRATGYGSNKPYTIARHVPAAPVTVADGEYLRVTYTISIAT
jgi:hypothetical protein